ncbi:carboxypeptidase regulatory-like domain-containing protein [Candidatus Woesearchaeota archaeon]|nr:carboxypeptidase regulatory-like domain-containing protein [Candidatus Woesearchaeota archaeon]
MRRQKRGVAVASAVLFLALILIASVTLVSAQEKTQTAGCYYFPQGSSDVSCKAGGVTQEAAKEDCDSRSGCTLTDWFKPGSTCADIPECAIVTCSASKYACQEVPLGTCTQAGGKEILSSEMATECTKGCCVVALPDKPFCAPQLLFKSQCAEVAAQKQGSQLNYNFYNPDFMTVEICQQQYCKTTTVEGELSGVVSDASGKPISGAQLSILATTRTVVSDASGKYSFPKLIPSTYSVKASAPGYLDHVLSISVSAGPSTTRDFTLQKAAGAATVIVLVRDINGKPLPGVTVAWKGPVQQTQKTDAQGSASISNAPAGNYGVLVSAVGFVSQELTKTVSDGTTTFEVTLLKAAFQGVQGTTFVNGEKTYGVSIYVDGFFKGKSQYGDGNAIGMYSIALPADGKEHTISATFQEFSSPIHTITIASGQALSLDLFLAPLKGECTPEGANPQKNVEVFTARAVPGERKVRLEWKKPCPKVASYTLVKKESEKTVYTRSVSGADTTLIDEENLEWGKTYTYTLAAVFDSALSSKEAVAATITLGDKECEGRYSTENQLWSSFCTVEERQTVLTCTDENTLTAVQDCSSLGNTWFCAQTTATTASCKDGGICAVNTAPFGLSASSEVCYGPNDDNFCYYDFSAKTIANQCSSCAAVESCFDYNSRNACEKNNCFSSSCEWVDTAANPLLVDYSYLYAAGIFSPLATSPETGAGYCVEKEYSQDDQCSLCSPGASFLENYFCTPRVCSSLGRCFANPELTSCEKCNEVPTPDATCYSYTSEMECVGAGGVRKDNFNRLELSGDRCSWGRCAWDGARCIKDGDVDGQDDCAEVKGSTTACAVDVTPPTTVLAGSPIVTLAQSVVEFVADSSSPKPGQGNTLKNFYYCVTPAGVTNTCTSDRFDSLSFKGLSSKESIFVNISQQQSVATAKPEGEMFAVYFYSEDVFSNQEQVQQGALYIDVIPPAFSIVATTSTSGTTSQLDVHLEDVNELMGCTFVLNQLLPQGETKTVAVSAEELNKKALFSGLLGVRYGLAVTCTDQHGNSNLREEQYLFDLEQEIDIVYPVKGKTIAQTTVPFQVETKVGSTCVLYDAATNERIVDFLTTEEGMTHQTSPVSLVEGDYVGAHKVICTELITGKTHEDYFDFKIDFTPASVVVELQEGKRVIRHEDDGWQDSFVSAASVLLTCALGEASCKEIFYCLGEQCTPADVSGYLRYDQSFIVKQTTKLCYYATREEELIFEDVSCGNILVEGFGITLEKPQRSTYGGEMWGISATPTFDWQFSTRVPSQECRFDFNSKFDYSTLAKYKWKEKDGAGKYLFEKFPDSVFSSYDSNGGTKTVYVQCTNAEGEHSPVQKMILEYDPTPPVITTASSSPEPVIEGISTLLNVKTDDKSICYFTDTANGKTYPFPGVEERKLDTIHEATFYVDDFVGDKKEYLLSVLCENGAGVLSAPRNVTVHVDYTQKGSITSITPQDAFFKNGPITGEVLTSKTGYCEVKKGNEHILFTETNGKIHRVPLNDTTDGKHTVPLRCFLGDFEQQGEFSYTIDRQAPVIESVDDGNATCGKESWSVLVKTNETAIANYSYIVYTATGSSSTFGGKNVFTKGAMVYQNTVGSDMPLIVPLTGFVVSDQNKSDGNGTKNGTKTNSIKGLIISVSATDKAGNVGLFKESDGVQLTNASASSCVSDTKLPTVSFSVVNSSSCTSRLVSMTCSDSTGCQNYFYGIGKTPETCSPLLPYNGKNMEIASTSYICYRAQDAVGKNISSSTKITFDDGDGDGVADSCDLCANTLAGKAVDGDGCATGQIGGLEGTVDSDGDGLPDAWEKQFDSLTCRLSAISKDSDQNGINDGQEDYDDDSLNNYQEFSNGKNPCVKEVVDKEEKPEETVPSAFVEEPSNGIAWVLLILGIILAVGGLGYLVYEYVNSRKQSAPAVGRAIHPGSVSTGRPSAAVARPGIADQFAAWRRARMVRAKAKERASLFNEFGKGKSLGSLQDLAQKYVERKAEIQPHLQGQEKGVFQKLETIAQQTKSKDISQVVSKSEAESIFERLREISKKKKKEE